MGNQFNYFAPIPPIKLVGKRDESIMGKMIKKFPMTQEVLTNTFEIWAYRFNSNGIVWYRKASVCPER